MNATLERAYVLYEQTRYELAIAELNIVLNGAPKNAEVYALLSLCQCHMKQFSEADNAARTAISLEPENPLGFYALAYLNYIQQQYKRAQATLEEALRLNPNYPSFWVLLAWIHIERGHPQIALQAAEQGLAVDPHYLSCMVLRALALSQLNQLEEANAAVNTALMKDPENSTSHAIQGWLLLKQNQTQAALTAFKTALRLNPNIEWSRLGLIESLKSRSGFYRLIHKTYEWIGKIQRSAWIGAAYVGNGIFLLFFLRNLLLVIKSLFDLGLCFDPFARLVLSRSEKLSAWLVGAEVCLATIALSIWLSSQNPGAIICSIVFVLLIAPLTARSFACKKGRRLFNLLCTTNLGLITLLISFGIGLSFYPAWSELSEVLLWSALAVLNILFMGFLIFVLIMFVVRLIQASSKLFKGRFRKRIIS